MHEPPLIKGDSTLMSQVAPIFLVQGWCTLTRRRLESAEGCSTLADASRPTLTQGCLPLASQAWPASGGSTLAERCWCSDPADKQLSMTSLNTLGASEITTMSKSLKETCSSVESYSTVLSPYLGDDQCNPDKTQILTPCPTKCPTIQHSEFDYESGPLWPVPLDHVQHTPKVSLDAADVALPMPLLMNFHNTGFHPVAHSLRMAQVQVTTISTGYLQTCEQSIQLDTGLFAYCHLVGEHATLAAGKHLRVVFVQGYSAFHVE